MAVKVVIDAEWFVINGKKYVKQFAFSVLCGGHHGVYSITLPGWVRAHKLTLERQARFSHGLHWNAVGNYVYSDITKALENMALRIAEPLSEIAFYAKRAEKCHLLQNYVGPVANLEELGCPKYNNLSYIPQTTLGRAFTFDLWLDSDW